MRRLIRGVRQLMPPWWSIAVYWLVTLGLLFLTTMGLEPGAERGGALWGLPLLHFGHSPSEVLNNAYVEMMRHVWTLFTLPYVLLIASKPLRYSFHNNFLLFLRYSRSSRLSIEVMRLAALLSLLVVACLPFLAGSLWGIRWPGLSGEQAATAFFSCLACLALVTTFVYLLSALGTPAEVSVGAGIAVPFLLEGLLVLSSKGGWELASKWLPAGLPYSIDSYRDEPVLVAAALAVGIVVARLVTCCHTRWLRQSASLVDDVCS